MKHRAGKPTCTRSDGLDGQRGGAQGRIPPESATNTLTVDASKADSVRLFVNGVQVAAIAVASFGNIDGAVGLRVNHNLDVHVSGFTVTPKK